MVLLENFRTLAINYVAVTVDKVALFVYSAAHVVSQDTCAASLRNDVAVGVLVKDSNNIFHIEALSIVIEQLLDIAIIKLLSVELLPSMLVDNMPVAALLKPAEAIDTASLLVHVEALLGLQELGNGATRALVILEVEITHQVMWVEIKLLNAEGSWNLALFIDVCGIEELLFGIILENVTRVGVL